MCNGFATYAQEKFIKHIVSQGETVGEIAQKYKISNAVIYGHNPEAKKGLRLQSLLLIPAASLVESKNNEGLLDSESLVVVKKHAVLPKETIYGITKQYGITTEELYLYNPSLKKSGLQKGIVVKIPLKNSSSKPFVSPSDESKVTAGKNNSPIDTPKNEKSRNKIEIDNSISEIVREVLPQETKYAIAKQYNITIAELEKFNPILKVKSLKVGQKLVIPVTKQNSSIIKNVVTEPEAKNIHPISNQIQLNITANSDSSILTDEGLYAEFVHEVLPKETKYGIAREYGLSVEDLESQNPKIVKKLLVGQKLNIRTLKRFVAENGSDKEESSLLEINQFRKTENKMNLFLGSEFVDQLISFASENIGVKYRAGGNTKEGFDCSGLICSTFSAFDIQLPRSSVEQAQFGVKIKNEEAKKGDLIFFKTNGRGRINHVGMVVEVTGDDIKFIHASSSGVIISSVKEKYYSKRLSQINRVL